MFDLFDACAKGDIEAVKRSITNGGSKDTALRYACMNGRLELVKYLVDHGANIGASNEYALKWAIHANQHEVVKYLKNRMRLKTFEAI